MDLASLRKRQGVLARRERELHTKLTAVRDRLDRLAGELDKVAMHRTRPPTMMMASGLPQVINLIDRRRRRQ